MTRKWNIVNDQSNWNYAVKNEIIYSIEVLKTSICVFNDAYILNGESGTNCITNIDGTTIGDIED